MQDKKEYIICSAIHYHNYLFSIYNDEFPSHQPRNIDVGYVMCGRRHHNVINLHYYLTKLKLSETPHTSGFLTNLDRFVDRKEGLRLALLANQVLSVENLRGDELYSEDLW